MATGNGMACGFPPSSPDDPSPSPLPTQNENIVPTKDQAERISVLQEQADLFTRKIEAERRTVEVRRPPCPWP